MRNRIYFAALFVLWSACASQTYAALDGYLAHLAAGRREEEGESGQFHLQTDGDGDRYFVYQTNNGQYRKERRLRDGSVVGTTGWVDAAGYLRLQEYIADDQGYRIFKSKTVYVGPERSIADSLQIAKNAPTDPGYGFTPLPLPASTVSPPSPRTATRPASPTSFAHTFPFEVSVTPPSVYRSSTFLPSTTQTPAVQVSPNSIDTLSTSRRDFRPITSDEASTPVLPPSFYIPPSGDDNDLGYGSTSAATPYRLDNFNPNSYRHSGEWRRRVGTSRYRYTPPNSISDGYTPQFPTYDGNALTTRGGFRYYLPKLYHEERGESADGSQTGSFGYVDPFGIRRVIYYNADPGVGFQVRKNNRYVGHDATPYDPRTAS